MSDLFADQRQGLVGLLQLQGHLDGQPPRLLEVPVKIRALTASGTFRYHGWYRVQPSADGRAWQIQSASLQPTLD